MTSGVPDTPHQIRFIYWIAIALVLFGTGLALGTIIEDTILSEYIDSVFGSFLSIEDTGIVLETFTVTLMIFILVKNVIALCSSFVLAPFFGLLPVFSLVLNGAIISYVGSGVVAEESLGYFLSGILPHGIIELPAFLIGQAAALSFAFAAVYAFFTRDRNKLLMPAFKHNGKIVAVMLGLMIPAAAIEAFVTPRFIG